MAKQTVALYTVTSGDRAERARTSLADALGDAQLGDVDDAGVFEVAVDAESPDAARDLVREAFARAGTGDDFVIRETTEGREMDPDDPRQGPAPDGGEAAGDSDSRSPVADAASAVAAAASSGDTQAARDAARSAAADAAEAVRAAASSAREAVDDKGVAGAASDYATAAQQRDWSRYAPVGGLFLVLLLLLRRGRR
jgi:hypothetical protein